MRLAVKKIILLAAVLALLFCCAGCHFGGSVSDLYALPQMPVRYQEL